MSTPYASTPPPMPVRAPLRNHPPPQRNTPCRSQLTGTGSRWVATCTVCCRRRGCCCRKPSGGPGRGSGVVVLVGCEVPQPRTALRVELLLGRGAGRIPVLLGLTLLVARGTRGLGQSQG